ncbi:bile acid:sodium symporter family protein [Thermaurantimonas aggregans]|nr:bile acid:sodium symporter family protein [Thermaurantimonas aggregans]MCX8148441.1 bile acid:sodium symporter family protein [Thermaurantimonas aggregans]
MQTNILTEVFLPISLAIIMLGMGLGLTWDDFARIVKFPKSVAAGLVNQLLLLPLVGLLIVSTIPITKELAVGLMVLAACPGGVTSNLITHLSRGNTALSITLTAITSVITIFTIPFIVNFSLDFFMGKEANIELPVGKTMIQIFGVTLVPVAIGMFIRKKASAFAEKADRPVRIFSAVIFALIVLAAILKERQNLPEYFRTAGLAALLLNLATMALGWFSGAITGIPYEDKISIVIESGIQNGTLGIMITATLLENPAMTVAPALYSLIMFMTGGLLIIGFSRKRQLAEA